MTYHQQSIQSLRKRYYEGSSGLILVYSVVDRPSFDNASKWLVEAHGFMGELPPLLVVANKIDLRSEYPEKEIVTSDEGKAFTDKFSKKLKVPAIFLETSALTGENIDKAFETLTGMMVRDEDRQEVAEKPGLEAIVESLAENASKTKAEIDEVTLLASDSEYLKEEQIGRAMTELVNLRAELKKAEEELANTISKIETQLINLKNVVHVKKIMYEHLQQQLQQTRKEWSEAYEEYIKLDKRKKAELERRTEQMIDIRKRIDNVGRIVRTRVGDLDLKKMTNGP